MTETTLFYIYSAAVVGGAGFVILLLLKQIFSRRGLISRSLNMELLLVRFAPMQPTEREGIQQIREKIALMEQLYANLYEVHDSWWRTFVYGKPAFSLELTVPAKGEELSFYIAVPRRLTRAVEKIIQGIFPDAFVEVSRDYNIFDPESVAAASQLFLKENPFYPVRTYQKLEGDPLKGITNVFTKLAKEGEGAALQIVARPAPKKWARMLRDRARTLFHGKKSAEGLRRFVDVVEDVVSMTPTPEDQKKTEESRRATPHEEELVRAFEGKAAKALFEVNIRLVASAPDSIRAAAMLQGLEAAFAQFADMGSNSFSSNRVERRKLKELLFNFSFRNFDDGRAVILGTEELTSLFHFPNVPLETPKLNVLKAREAAAPANLPEAGLLLGYNMFRAEKSDIRILDEDRRRHLYTIGQTGTGKSVFLENMIRQDVQNGKGVCVIDPHGELVQKILEFVPPDRADDVIYFNPGDVERPMGLNMLEYDERFPEQKTFIINELFSIFQKLYGAVPESMGPIFEQYFRNATGLVMDDPASGNTLLEISRVMSDKAFRDLKISRAKNIVVKRFWTEIAEKAGGEASLKDMVPYITSKFDVFLANEIMRPIIAQEKSAFNFREVMDTGKILLVNLSKGRLGDINSSLIGLIIVGKILMAALARGDSPQETRKDFYLYIDEFQNVTTDSIATILSEARKYRLDLIITHQYIGQLKEEIKKAVFGNVGSMVTFRIGSDDAEFVAKQYKPIFTEQDLLNIDNANCCMKLLVRGQTTTPFSMKTYPPENGDRAVAEQVKELSRTKYGRSRVEIEQEIIDRHEKEIVSTSGPRYQ